MQREQPQVKDTQEFYVIVDVLPSSERESNALILTRLDRLAGQLVLLFT